MPNRPQCFGTLALAKCGEGDSTECALCDTLKPSGEMVTIAGLNVCPACVPDTSAKRAAELRTAMRDIAKTGAGL